MGFNYNPDFNGATRFGVGPVQHNIKNGIRSTAINEYLIPTSKNYPNLQIFLYSTVTKNSL